MAIFDFVQNPIVPGVQHDGSMNNISYDQQQQQYNQYQQMQQQLNPNYNRPPAPPIQVPTPTISKGYGFSVIPDEDEEIVSSNLSVPIPDVGLEPPAEVKRRGRRKKEENEIAPNNNTDMVRDNYIENNSAINSYGATAVLLNNTLEQIDVLAGEIKSELDQVRSNRTLKGKYNYITNLTENLSSLIGSRIQVVKEINSMISKANELDYKKEKDRAMVTNNQDDDKYIMDLYNAFIKNPMGIDNNNSNLGPNILQTSVAGTPNIIRAPIAGDQQQNGITDMGFLNYMSNVTPEQNMMYYENDPNVKTCVIFDASNGNKFFQVMNIATGQAIPNVTTLDNRFMEDTVLDLKNRIAKNSNLHETYPLIVINENIVNEY